MKNKMGLIIFLCLLGVFGVYFFLNLQQFKPLLSINVYALGFIACANVATLITNGLFIKFILKPFGKFISVSESVYVSLISSVGNFFAPVGGGFGFRAVYLKKKHGLAYSDYITTLYGNYIIVFLVSSFVALLALYLLRGKQTAAYYVLTLLFTGIFSVALLLSVIKLPKLNISKIKPKFLNYFVRTVSNMIDGWNRIISNRKLLTQLVGLVTFNFLAAVFIAKLEIAALHFTISTPALLLFSVLGSLSLFVNITPANLGVKEAIYIFSASVINFSTSQILAIALVDRGILFLVLGGSWLIYPRLKRHYKISSVDQAA